MRHFRKFDVLQFSYTNYKGVTEMRTVMFLGLDYGTNEWYPEPQWFMRCHDQDRDAERCFALNKINANYIKVIKI